MVQFIYTENGKPKTSLDENERRNLIGRLNQDLTKSLHLTSTINKNRKENNYEQGRIIK